MAKLAGQGRPSLIGRAWERAEAARASSQAAGGHGQVLTVAGEPGVGKSELARAVAADAARDHGALVLWGDCYEGASQTPFGPWDAVFSPLGGLAVAGSAGLSSPDARLALFVSAHAALATARANGPVAVVVDDLQWAPPDSLALFEFLAARAATLGIVLVGTYRDPDLLLGGPGMRDVLASVARVPAATHVHLRGLDPEQVGAFMDARLGEGVPRAVASAVHAHTGGNPFYVREVANALVAEGLLVRENGRWLTHVSVPAIVIPPTVRHVVRARTDALSPGARAILNAASAFPEGFELDVVAAIARQDEAPALDALEELLAAGFVRQAVPPALPYAFAHAIVRHAIDEGRSPDRSARLHRRAAEVLAGVRPGQYATAVEQWWRSRTVAGSEAGVPVGLAAADQAAASQAHGQAAHLLVLTLDLAPAAHPQRPEVLSCLALAAARALDADQATAAVAEVLPLLGPEAGAGLVVDVAEALREGAPPRTWEPLVTTALAGLTGGGGLGRARLLACLDPVSTVASGALRSGRWDGLPAEAVAALDRRR